MGLEQPGLGEEGGLEQDELSGPSTPACDSGMILWLLSFWLCPLGVECVLSAPLQPCSCVSVGVTQGR